MWVFIFEITTLLYLGETTTGMGGEGEPHYNERAIDVPGVSNTPRLGKDSYVAPKNLYQSMKTLRGKVVLGFLFGYDG